MAARTSGVAAGCHDHHNLDKKQRGEWDFRSCPHKREQNFEPTCPFGHGISNPNFENNNNNDNQSENTRSFELFPSFSFKEYLKAQNRCNVRQLMYYARKYHRVLISGDGSVITATASPSVSGMPLKR